MKVGGLLAGGALSTAGGALATAGLELPAAGGLPDCAALLELPGAGALPAGVAPFEPAGAGAAVLAMPPAALWFEPVPPGTRLLEAELPDVAGRLEAVERAAVEPPKTPDPLD